MQKDDFIREDLLRVFDAMIKDGYDPVKQFSGFILSEDPTYITNCSNARALIRRIDRDELMGELVKHYLELD